MSKLLEPDRIKAELSQLRKFLDEIEPTYSPCSRGVDISSVRARWVREFWLSVDYYRLTGLMLFAPDGLYSPLVKRLKLTQESLPSQPIFLAQDGYTAWYIDGTDTCDDPPVMVINQDMPRSEVEYESFLAFATRAVVQAALWYWPYVVVDSNPMLEGEILFPSLNRRIQRLGRLVLVAFDDSPSAHDSRQMVFFRELYDLVCSSIPWENFSFGNFGRVYCRAKLSEYISHIQVENFPVEALDGSVVIPTPGERIWLRRLVGDHGILLFQGRGRQETANELELYCDRPAQKDCLSWLRSIGAKVSTIDGKKPRSKKAK